MVGVARHAAQMQLSIDIGSEPITGSVTVDSGMTQPFSGWIELVAAIESARDTGAWVGGEGRGAALERAGVDGDAQPL